MQTRALPVLVAVAACAIHHRRHPDEGIRFLALDRRSCFQLAPPPDVPRFVVHGSTDAPGGVLLPVPVLGQEFQHGLPHFRAPAVGVATGMPDDLGVRAQFDRAVCRRVEDDTAGPPHDLPHQRHIGVDPILRTFQEYGVVNGRDQGKSMPRAPDIGEAEIDRRSLLAPENF